MNIIHPTIVLVLYVLWRLKYSSSYVLIWVSMKRLSLKPMPCLKKIWIFIHEFETFYWDYVISTQLLLLLHSIRIKITTLHEACENNTRLYFLRFSKNELNILKKKTFSITLHVKLSKLNRKYSILKLRVSFCKFCRSTWNKRR